MVSGLEKSDDTGNWLISAKWMPPRYHVSVIRRARLINLLDSSLKHNICLVTAPAGFGKTTLLSQWRKNILARNITVAWLTLDETDGDVNNFLCYIIFSLIAAGLDLGRLEMLAEQGLSDTSPRSCLGLLLTKISEYNDGVVLIFDDYHRVKTPEIDHLMDDLLDNMPDNFHVVINSRERPQFDLSKLRSMGQLIEFSPEELRFDQFEMKEVLPIGLTEGQYASLLDKTEGWPVALQLASQLIASGGDKDQIIKSFSGKTEHLAEYLSEQIMNKCSEEMQEFLIKTSILERVNNSLAFTVCGIKNGFEKLEKTGSINALFVPIDDERKWLRYHHLFSEFLKEKLRQRYPDEILDLYLKASTWFEAENNLNEAVRYACLAKNYERAAEMIEKAGGWELILYGGIGFLRSLLRYIPEEHYKDYPRLQIARAYLYQKEGKIREARNYIELARCNPTLQANDFKKNLKAFNRDFKTLEILQVTYEDSYSSNNRQQLLDYIKKVDPTDALSLGVIYCALTLISECQGLFDKGLTYIHDGIRSMRQASSVLGLNYCYIHIGQLCFYKGNLRQSEAYFREAQHMADENFGSDSGLKYTADISLFSLKDWRGEMGDDLQHFEAVLSHAEDFDGWFEIYIGAFELLLSRACQEIKNEPLEILRDRCQKVAEERTIERLAVFVECCNLIIATRENNALEAERILFKVQKYITPKNWKSDSSLWRPYHYMGLAAAKWFIKSQDYDKARLLLEDLADCCHTIGAHCFIISVLVTQADLEYQCNMMGVASDYLFDAAAMAWPENIVRPFTDNENIVHIISATNGVRREKNIDRLALNFLQKCAEKVKKVKKNALSQQNILSSREMEVLIELQRGLSNKEIARALEMTEHTVKFHLKNIFPKLGVDKRARAIIAAQEMGLFG
ncbi:MAG: LuxR C-terminal-related transcriptional regulator [Emcibacter sp.]|nr:LuxR C-terminal-related transcriptional regulator [Emcibacter sp.]